MLRSILGHPNAADADVPRGHSSLNGALDLNLKLSKPENGFLRCEVKKNRNGDPNLAFGLRIEVDDFGQDEDGDPIIVPRAVEHDLPEPKAKLTAYKAKTRALLIDGMPVKEWKKKASELGRVSSHDDYKQRHKAVTRAIQALIDKGLVRMDRECAHRAGGEALELLNRTMMRGCSSEYPHIPTLSPRIPMEIGKTIPNIPPCP